MKANKISILITLYLFLCITKSLFASSISLPININGYYLIRLPGSSKYIQNTLSKLPDNIIFSIPDINNASNTSFMLDGHLVKAYPGTVFKISKSSFIPLSGRFEFSSDETATNSINIIANNCNAGYSYGHFLIEATPDNGIFFAMKNRGSAWVKDHYRKVFELKSGQQLQVPLFGESILRNRVEAFWGKDPSSFGNLGEIGQETAYGIVGKDTPSYKTKALSNKKKKQIDDNNDSLDNEKEVNDKNVEDDNNETENKQSNKIIEN